MNAFICRNRGTCVDAPGDPVGSDGTDDNGQFSIVIDADALVGNLLLLEASVDGVKIRAIITPNQLHIGPSGLLAARVRAADVAEFFVDPISEAAVQVLDAAGIDNYSDDGVEAVIAAVTAATTDSTFDGQPTQQAVESAAATAANDPTVQEVLQTERFTPTPTATVTPTPSTTPTPSATPTSTPIPCVGDCNGDKHVTVDEIITMVNIALGNADASECEPGDVNLDGEITVDEILTAVKNALNGCT